MKKILAAFLSLAMSVTLFACAKEKDRDGYILDGENEIYPDEFLEIDGEKISFGKFRYYYLNYRDMYIDENGAEYFDDEDHENELKDEILKSLKDEIAIQKLAGEKKISLSKEEKKSIRNDIDDTVSFYGGKEEFAKTLKESYMTFSLFEEMSEFSALYSKVFQKLFEDGSDYSWSNAKFVDYYRENYIAVQEIRINYVGGENKNDCPETSAKAETVISDLNSGTDFWKCVEKFGEDSNMERYPNGYYFTKGQAEDILYEVSKGLAENEVSSPVKADGGIFIIKRIPLVDEEIQKNKEAALFGITDSESGIEFSGAYEDEFEKIFSEKAENLNVTFPEIWNKISSKTVF